MDDDSLAQLERIEELISALATLPWLAPDALEQCRADLLSFDAAHWPFVRLLCPPLYAELSLLLRDSMSALPWSTVPRISVIVPVYQARHDLLYAALASLKQQVGVAISCLVSLDGHEPDEAIVASVLAQLADSEPSPCWQVSVLVSPRNEGVGRCRNRALKQIDTPYFTCLDADDIFHPLRCLHALLLLEKLGVDRLNTGWCRFSMAENKLVLINGALSSLGLNSFVARTCLLQRYGYLADLRVHEDSEYQQRLRFFGAAMQSTAVVGHFLNTEVHPDYRSLSTPLRREISPIHGHPFLCGTVIAAADDSRRRLDAEHEQLYQRLLADALTAAFPGL